MRPRGTQRSASDRSLHGRLLGSSRPPRSAIASRRLKILPILSHFSFAMFSPAFTSSSSPPLPAHTCLPCSACMPSLPLPPFPIFALSLSPHPPSPHLPSFSSPPSTLISPPLPLLPHRRLDVPIPSPPILFPTHSIHGDAKNIITTTLPPPPSPPPPTLLG